MPTYLCKQGHKHKKSYHADNCHWCKKREEKNMREIQRLLDEKKKEKGVYI